MQEIALQNIDIHTFQQDLIDWYQANKRDLPWRKDQDPYKIWVSEVMLQQTKVDTVIPYFNRFMVNYPTLKDLAEADQQDVLKAWEGLGYYSRARNLQTAVREVVAIYNGEVPNDPKVLGSLKGVGPYTKGAILSIAFDQPEPAVDGNVMRVLSRVLKIEEDITQQRVKKQFENHVRQLISREDPSSFNQGIMELGALICTPKSPMCMFCPVQKHCQAFAEGMEEELPIKKKAKRQKRIPYIALLIKNSDNQFVIEKRPDQGLLANLWQFPMVQSKNTNIEEAKKQFEEEYGITIEIGEKKGTLKHVFSHLIWELEIYEAEMIQHQSTKNKHLHFAEKRELRSYPFPVSHVNMMKYI